MRIHTVFETSTLCCSTREPYSVIRKSTVSHRIWPRKTLTENQSRIRPRRGQPTAPKTRALPGHSYVFALFSASELPSEPIALGPGGSNAASCLS